MDSTSPSHGQHLPWAAPTLDSPLVNKRVTDFFGRGGCVTILFVGFKHVSVRREEKLSIFSNKYSVTENAESYRKFSLHCLKVTK